MAIKSIEWLGMYEAGTVQVKSRWMSDEIVRLYKVPVDKIRLVSPGSQGWMKEIVKTYGAVAEAGVP